MGGGGDSVDDVARYPYRIIARSLSYAGRFHCRCLDLPGSWCDNVVAALERVEKHVHASGGEYRSVHK